ncbi:MAG: hypothetical protein K2H90_09640 [Oscillospiraceae bacterium]|nr:hypothetical protein [Oscillospiraceae bacterium]
MGKKHKIITVILMYAMAFSLILPLLLWLPEIGSAISKLFHGDRIHVYTEIAIFIQGNSIMYTLADFYNNFFTPLICTFIAFFNTAYAIMWLEAVYKFKSEVSKRPVRYWIYLAVSLGALVLHWLSFREIFSWLIAG